ncbi:MAG: hypothetical protein C5B53_07285 [Candidatus Melainabacteria bacterium]|nr:MAG: hypothetical protein C5B53_07285 [Candidatus Melainabacteria bacterium]
MLSMIFNHPYFRFFLALAIPAGILGLWFYAKYTAEQEVGITAKQIKKNPINDKILVDDYQLKEIDDLNHLRWRLVAAQGVTDPATRDVALKTVNVDYFDKGKIKIHLSAPVGVANEGTKAVELDAEKDQRVQAIGEEGKAKLEATKVELIKKNQFLATGGVNILWPGVAKVRGDKAEGSLASTDLKKLKIMGNTHALIGLGKEGG